MKNLFNAFTAVLLAFCSSTALYADCVILNESAEKEIMNKWSSASTVTYTISNPRPADQLTFNYSEGSKVATGGVTVTAKYSDGSSQTIINDKDNSSQSYNFNQKIVSELQFKGTGTLSKHISNVRLTQAAYFNAPSFNDFGSAKVNTVEGKQTCQMGWSDTAPMQISISGEGASQFAYTLTGNSQTCTYGTAALSITYKHDVVGTHAATLTLSNGTYSYTINLTGTTEKKDQTITWHKDWSSDKPSIPIGKEVTNAAAATSNLPITYTSSDENVIAITNDGHAFRAIAAGEAVITATQSGSDEWAEAPSVSKTFVATAKQIQFISWSQNLSRLKTTDAPISLTAQVQIVNAESGERTDNPERTALLTYSSANEAVVAVEGNTLTITGEGETTLTAHIAGDENYESATATMPVRVRVPSVGCEDMLVLDYSQEIEFFQMNTGEMTGDAIAINRSNGIPDKLTFQHKGEYWTLGVKYYKGEIKVQESTDNGNNWRDLYSVTPTVGTYQESAPVQISRNATHIRFVRPSGAQGYHYVKDIEITPAQYLEANTSTLSVEQSIVGDNITKEVVINYSNVKDEVQITHTSPIITLSASSLMNECGDFGTATLSLTIAPVAVGTTHDTIVISDAVSGMKVSIPVVVYTQRNHQSIEWNDTLSTILTTDTIALTATARTDIQYISSDSAIAYAEGNILHIITYGTITLTAVAEATDLYEEATLSQDITIQPVTPEITSLPAASNIRVGQSFSESILTGGSAAVDGMFIWQDSDDNYIPIDIEGQYTASVMFIPTNINWYAIVRDIEVGVVVGDRASTGVHHPMDEVLPTAEKVLIDGRICIIRQGEMYDISGRKVK